MKHWQAVAVGLTLALGSAAGTTSALASAPETVLISATSRGDRAGGTDVGPGAVDGSGRFVAFSSVSEALAAGAEGAFAQVYVRDTLTGRLEWLSKPLVGASTGSSYVDDISRDGRYVAFTSDANGLVPGDHDGLRDAFRYDRVTRRLIDVGVQPDGRRFRFAVEGGKLSPDGRFMTFSADTKNTYVYSENTYREADGFVVDLVRRTSRPVPVGSAGERLPGRHFAMDVSADGRRVLVQAAVLVEGTFGQAWVTDVVSGKSTLLSVDRSGKPVHGDVLGISDDGRRVLFQADGDVLRRNFACPTCGQSYLKDLTTGRVTPAVTDRDGGPLTYGSDTARMSADGRFIAFETGSPDMVPPHREPRRDVFLRDTTTGDVREMNIAVPRVLRGRTYLDDVSGDGRAVLFRVGQGGTGDTSDSFLRVWR